MESVEQKTCAGHVRVYRVSAVLRQRRESLSGVFWYSERNVKGLLRRGEATEMVKAMQRGELKPGDTKALIQAGRDRKLQLKIQSAANTAESIAQEEF